MIRSGLFRIPGYQTKSLSNEDLVQLKYFLEKNTDYFELVTGLPFNPLDTQSIFEDIPEGKLTKDKILIGIYSTQGSLVGVLDAIRDHPGRGDWWLGLLLIDPMFRGKGLGKEVYSAFEKWITERDAINVYLGVMESNHRAYQFWQNLGFEVIQKRPPKRFGTLDQEVIVMKRLI
jgi:ribosomal protein S18 acetylase RimI-like enzyme